MSRSQQNLFAEEEPPSIWERCQECISDPKGQLTGLAKSWEEWMENLGNRVEWLANSRPGELCSIFLDFLGISSCLQYIAETYILTEYVNAVENGESSMTLRAILDVFKYIEVGTAGCLFSNYLLHLYLAHHIAEVVFDPKELVEVLTLIPTMFIFSTEYHEINEIEDMTRWKSHDAGAIVRYVIRAARTVRILRLLRWQNAIDRIENDVLRKIYETVLYMGMIFLFCTGLMQFLERSAGQLCDPDADDDDSCHMNRFLKYHEWLYFIVVTCSTVGFGDISPATTSGRVVAMLLFIVVIVLIPAKTNDLIYWMSSTTPWERASYHAHHRSQRWHVLIVGDLTSTSMSDFLNELLHPDHRGDVDNTYLECVILQSHPPSYEVRELMKDKRYKPVLHYLQGNPLHTSDLKRAHAESASAIFIFCNKFSSDEDEEDAHTILQQYALKRYVLLHGPKPKPIFCSQLIRPENKRHLLPNTELCDNLVFLNEVKMGILAKSCTCPGTATLIFNMLSSFSDEEQVDLESLGVPKWMVEYQEGFDWEMYSVELDSTFRGVPFAQAAAKVYQTHGIILFALGLAKVEEITVNKKKKRSFSSYRIILNPGHTQIPDDASYWVEGFIISRNRIERISLEQDSMNAQELRRQNGSVQSRIKHLNKIQLRHDIMKTDFSVSASKLGKEEDKQVAEGRSRWKTFKGRATFMSKFNKSNAYLLNISYRGEGRQRFEHEAYYFRDDLEVLADTKKLRERLVIHSAESLQVSNHLIVTVGRETLPNLADLIKPLRARFMGKIVPVVVIYPHKIPGGVVQAICKYPEVYLVRGSHLNEKDLIRAGIFTASYVIMLTNDISRENLTVAESASQLGMESLADAGNIFAYKLVRNLNSHAHVVVEIVQRSNMAFLDNDGHNVLTGTTEFRMTPTFASGSMLTSSMLDTLTGQQFYNPELSWIVGQLISGPEGQEEMIYWRRLLGQADPTIDDMRGSTLNQIDVPNDFEGETFHDLVQFLLEKGVVPIGLYRGPDCDDNSEALGNRRGFVSTNPAGGTVIQRRRDKVFVLSQTMGAGKELEQSLHTLVDTVQENVRKNLDVVLEHKK